MSVAAPPKSSRPTACVLRHADAHLCPSTPPFFCPGAGSLGADPGPEPFITNGDVAAAKLARSRVSMRALRATRRETDTEALQASRAQDAQRKRVERASKKNILVLYAAIARDLWLSNCPKVCKRAKRRHAAYAIKLSRYNMVAEADAIDDACMAELADAKVRARAGIAAFIEDPSLWPLESDLPHVTSADPDRRSNIDAYVLKAAELGGVSPALRWSVTSLMRDELRAALQQAFEARHAAHKTARRALLDSAEARRAADALRRSQPEYLADLAARNAKYAATRAEQQAAYDAAAPQREAAAAAARAAVAAEWAVYNASRPASHVVRYRAFFRAWRAAAAIATPSSMAPRGWPIIDGVRVRTVAEVAVGIDTDSWHAACDHVAERSSEWFAAWCSLHRASHEDAFVEMFRMETDPTYFPSRDLDSDGDSLLTHVPYAGEVDSLRGPYWPSATDWDRSRACYTAVGEAAIETRARVAAAAAVAAPALHPVLNAFALKAYLLGRRFFVVSPATVVQRIARQRTMRECKSNRNADKLAAAKITSAHRADSARTAGEVVSAWFRAHRVSRRAAIARNGTPQLAIALSVEAPPTFYVIFGLLMRKIKFDRNYVTLGQATKLIAEHDEDERELYEREHAYDDELNCLGMDV